MNKIVEMIEKEYMKQEVPQFEVGEFYLPRRRIGGVSLEF